MRARGLMRLPVKRPSCSRRRPLPAPARDGVHVAAGPRSAPQPARRDLRPGARALAAEVHRTLVDKLDALTWPPPPCASASSIQRPAKPRCCSSTGRPAAPTSSGSSTPRQTRSETPSTSAGCRARSPTEHEPVDDRPPRRVCRQGAAAGRAPGGPRHRAGVRAARRGRESRSRGWCSRGRAGRGRARWVVAVEVSLRRIGESFARFRPGEVGRGLPARRRGQGHRPPDKELMFKQASLSEHPLMRGRRATSGSAPAPPVPLLGLEGGGAGARRRGAAPAAPSRARRLSLARPRPARRGAPRLHLGPHHHHSGRRSCARPRWR